MRRRTTSYDKSYVGSSDSELKSDNLRKPALATRLANIRAAANLIKDLRAPVVPLAVARTEATRCKKLALAVAAGRLTLAEARAQLRGAA